MFLRKFDSHLGCLDTALNQRSSTFGMRLARLQHCLKTLRCSNCLGNKHAQQTCQLLRQVRCQTPAPLCRGTPIRPKKLTTAPRTTDWVLQRRLSRNELRPCINHNQHIHSARNSVDSMSHCKVGNDCAKLSGSMGF